MKKKSLIHMSLLTFICSMFIMASCEDDLIGQERANTPINNFEYFWNTFDTHYGLFETKQINWSSIYQTYRPRINDNTTDEELYKVFCEIILLLNDNHVNLYPTNGTLPVFPGGLLRYSNGVPVITKVQEDYDFDVVKSYLASYHEPTDNIRYGSLPGNLGYINISGTDSHAAVERNMKKVMHDLRETRGIIVDIRGFYGGSDPVSQYLAGCFASSKKLFMTTRKRNGPHHTDFTETSEWYVTPEGDFQYTKPVIVLTSSFTQSAGENFLLAMREFDHVRLIGDTTAGSMSENPNTEMLNGWIFSVSIGDFRAADGKSYESVGIPPHIQIRNNREDLLAGKDKSLEKAIEILN